MLCTISIAFSDICLYISLWCVVYQRFVWEGHTRQTMVESDWFTSGLFEKDILVRRWYNLTVLCGLPVVCLRRTDSSDDGRICLCCVVYQRFVWEGQTSQTMVESRSAVCFTRGLFWEGQTRQMMVESDCAVCFTRGLFEKDRLVRRW